MDSQIEIALRLRFVDALTYQEIENAMIKVQMLLSGLAKSIT